jgi:DNA-binding CsgD family transcriptional regulator
VQEEDNVVATFSSSASNQSNPFGTLRRHGVLCLYLVGLFGWATSVPLWGDVGIAWAAARGVDYGPLPVWFLATNVLSSILTGFVLDRRPGWARAWAGSTLLAALLATLLLYVAPAPVWPLCFAGMGLAASGTAVWGRWYAITVPIPWLGRVFGLAAAGVATLNWLFSWLARTFDPAVVLLLTLLPLAVAGLAVPRIQEAPAAAREFPAAHIPRRVKARTVVRYGLFVVLISVVAGLSYRYLVTTPISPFVDETLRRLPYIGGVLLAGVLADRRNLQSVLVFGAGLLALAFLVGAWSQHPVPAAISTGINGLAFGLLEGSPWLLLASLATRESAGRWFGWGLNLNIVPIILGALLAIPLAAVMDTNGGLLTPQHLGLIAAFVILLGILSLHGVTDPLTVLHTYSGLSGHLVERVPATTAARGVVTAAAALGAEADAMPDASASPSPAAGAPPALRAGVVDSAAGVPDSAAWAVDSAATTAHGPHRHAAPALAATPADLLARQFGDLLTPREMEIAQLAVLGIATRDIAAQMYISENTVKTHLRNIFRKTETANRNDLYRKLIAGSRQ